MCRLLAILLVLCAAVQAQGKGGKETLEQKRLQRIQELNRELRELPAKSPTGVARASDQKRIFLELAKFNHPQALRVLIRCVEDPAYAPVHAELLSILAEMPGAEEATLSPLMRQHISRDDPARRVARDYLLDQALRRRKDEFPHTLFYLAPTVEDRFLSLQVMGRIGSTHTIECANALVKDRSWSPDETGLMSCGTIALSMENEEGPAAACLLLLLALDSRFTRADAAKLRQATRTWHQTDLRTYVNLAQLSDRDPLTRRDTAVFLGAVGHEAARVPLERVACNRGEVAEVRAAAATALGGLRVAREDLAATLAKLLSDPDPMVRSGAIEGLLRLNVVQATEPLVSMLDGPHGAEARAALARRTGLQPDTDWRNWLRTAFPDPSEPPPAPPRDGK